MSTQIKSIRTGDFELLESGIAQVLSKELTIIIFDTVNITFEFEANEKSSESEILVNTSEDNFVRFRLININMPTYGTTSFVKFASLADNTDVYLSFKIHSLNDKTVRSLEYSIYKKYV